MISGDSADARKMFERLTGSQIDSLPVETIGDTRTVRLSTRDGRTITYRDALDSGSGLRRIQVSYPNGKHPLARGRTVKYTFSNEL